MIGLESDDIAPGAAIASCGSPFLCVALTSREALARARGDAQAMAALPGYGARGVYLFYPESARHLLARMFGMALGILEDPATGSAAVALGGLLASRAPVRTGLLEWTIEQGVDMGRPSHLELEAEKRDGVITAVRVGGGAVILARGRSAALTLLKGCRRPAWPACRPRRAGFRGSSFPLRRSSDRGRRVPCASHSVRPTRLRA